MNDSTLTYDGQAWSWNGDSLHATAMTYVPVGEASGWWAHALTPHEPVGWLCDNDDGPDVFAAAFGAEWASHVSELLDQAPDDDGNGDASRVPTAVVNDAWARVVVVRSLSQWFPEPIDELALRIDEALAWAAAGDDERARAAISVGLTTLVSLAHALWGDDAASDGIALPGYFTDVVSQAAELAERLVDPEDEDLELLRAVMQHRSALSPGDIDSLIQQLLSNLDHLAAAQVAGGGGGERVEVLSVSPSHVTARVLEWLAPWSSPVTATREGGTVTVRAELAQGAHPDYREVRSLAAFACDVSTGQLLARAMLRSEGAEDHVVAALAIDPQIEVAVGVFDLDRIHLVRTDPAGRYLSRVDRLALGRWVGLRKRALATGLGADSADALVLTEAVPGHLAKCEEQLAAIAARINVDTRLGDAAKRAALHKVKSALVPLPSGEVHRATLAEALLTIPRTEDAY